LITSTPEARICRSQFDKPAPVDDAFICGPPRPMSEIDIGATHARINAAP